MARYQNKPTLESVAMRRNQTLTELLTDWSITSDDDLVKCCEREGVNLPTNFTFTIPDVKKVIVVKNALVELPKENEEVSGKKVKKSKLTLDESSTGNEHVGMDTHSTIKSKDST